jgi:hypothetical protein
VMAIGALLCAVVEECPVVTAQIRGRRGKEELIMRRGLITAGASKRSLAQCLEARFFLPHFISVYG